MDAMNNFATNLNSLDTAFKNGVDFVKSVKDCEVLLEAVENSGYIRLRMALNVIGRIQTGFFIFTVFYLLYLLMVSGGHRDGRFHHMWKHHHKSIITLFVVLTVIVITYQVLNAYVKHYIEIFMAKQIDNIIGCSMELVKRISDNHIQNPNNQVKDATNLIPNETNATMEETENMYPYN